MDEENEVEETTHDRRKQYDVMRKEGFSDKDASEKVWPTTRDGIMRNIKEKADAAQEKVDVAQKKADAAQKKKDAK